MRGIAGLGLLIAATALASQARAAAKPNDDCATFAAILEGWPEAQGRDNYVRSSGPVVERRLQPLDLSAKEQAELLKARPPRGKPGMDRVACGWAKAAPAPSGPTVLTTVFSKPIWADDQSIAYVSVMVNLPDDVVTGLDCVVRRPGRDYVADCVQGEVLRIQLVQPPPQDEAPAIQR